MEDLKLSRPDRFWVSSMEFCKKYWRCHQMPERSFFVLGYQFPLCARCTGIALGYLTGIFISVFADVPFYCLLGVVPLILDGGIQKLTDYESTNGRRVLTGILYGFSTLSALIHLVRMMIRAI